MLPLRDHERSDRFPFVTIGLIVLNVIAFYVEMTAPDLDAFIKRYALVPAAVDFSSPSTLLPFITSQFLHGDFLHIGFNMWFLWIFGDNVEGRLGHIKYLLFYLAAGIAAGLTQYFFSLGSSIPMLGASGAVAGVLGAYFAWFPHHRVDALIPIGIGMIMRTVPASFALFFWIAGQVLSGVISIGAVAEGGVAWWAHIGGFAFGWVVAKIIGGQRELRGGG